MLPTFNVPPIGAKQGKLWGVTQLAFAFNSVESHGIVVNKGGFCSRHIHTEKWNRFFVLKGKLAVRLYLYDKFDAVDETVIGPGQVTDVPPKTWHEFEALEDVFAVEFYWVTLNAQDIDRDDDQRGGMKSD